MGGRGLGCAKKWWNMAFDYDDIDESKLTSEQKRLLRKKEVSNSSNFFAGALMGAGSGVGLVFLIGTIGFSAVGLTTGLAGLGAILGGGMLAGVVVFILITVFSGLVGMFKGMAKNHELRSAKKKLIREIKRSQNPRGGILGGMNKRGGENGPSGGSTSAGNAGRKFGNGQDGLNPGGDVARGSGSDADDWNLGMRKWGGGRSSIHASSRESEDNSRSWRKSGAGFGANPGDNLANGGEFRVKRVNEPSVGFTSASDPAPKFGDSFDNSSRESGISNRANDVPYRRNEENATSGGFTQAGNPGQRYGNSVGNSSQESDAWDKIDEQVEKLSEGLEKLGNSADKWLTKLGNWMDGDSSGGNSYQGGGSATGSRDSRSSQASPDDWAHGLDNHAYERRTPAKSSGGGDGFFSSIFRTTKAIVGGLIGLAISLGSLFVLGVTGFSAAGITSGLAAAGALLGGGMLAGLFVLVLPVVILAYWGGSKSSK